MTADKMQEILANHERWLRGDDGGKWANLSKTYLRGVDLSGANLSRADLSMAKLSGANLSMANLSRADLSMAKLSGANLSGANLSEANLSMANLSGANLSRANLSGASLSGADMIGADLSGASLSGADLSKISGIVLLPIHDPRGYRAVATVVDGGRIIFAGCRVFTIPEARAHWGEPYQGYRAIGDMYLAALDWLEALPNDAYTDPGKALEYLAAFGRGTSRVLAERAP